MLVPKCDVCGQPATIHETALESEAVVTRHLCAEHGESAWRATALPVVDAEALRAAEEQWRSLSEAEQEHLALVYRLTHRGP
jgi:hypothetical protein